MRGRSGTSGEGIGGGLSKASPKPHPLDQSPPEAFSPLRRKMNPWLRKADTNPVFDAFLRRRTLHGKARLFNVKPNIQILGIMGGTALIGVPLVLIADRVLGVPFFFMVYPLGLSIVVVAIVFQRIFKKEERPRFSIRYPSQLVMMESIHPEVMKDLWTCGIRGRDIAEAIALEKHAFFWQNVIGGGVLGFFLIGVATFVPFWGWWIFLPGITFFFLLIQGMMQGTNEPSATLSQSLNGRLRFLKQKSSRSGMEHLLSQLREIFDSKKLLHTLLMISIGITLLAMLTGVIVLASYITGRTGNWNWTHTPNFLLPMIVAGAGGIIAWYLRKRRRRNWIKSCRKLKTLCRQFDKPFDLYMRRIVLEDPDA